MVNLVRLEVFWRPVTAHLIEVTSLNTVCGLKLSCLYLLHATKQLKIFKTFVLLKVSGHPYAKLREWGAQALTILVKSALKVKTTVTESVRCILLVLQSCSFNLYADLSFIMFHVLINFNLDFLV